MNLRLGDRGRRSFMKIRSYKGKGKRRSYGDENRVRFRVFLRPLDSQFGSRTSLMDARNAVPPSCDMLLVFSEDSDERGGSVHVEAGATAQSVLGQGVHSIHRANMLFRWIERW
jgi:hypothetical protein